jgi:DNA-binding XRE family transcriptional regulator
MTKISADIEVRKRVYARYGGRCGICGEPLDYGAMHIDHIIPSARRGPDTEDNLQPSHRECNQCKATKIDPSLADRYPLRIGGWLLDGRKLKHARRFAPLTLRELAAMSGVTPQTIHRIEARKTQAANPSTIKKLATALGVAPVDLMTEHPTGRDS